MLGAIVKRRGFSAAILILWLAVGLWALRPYFLRPDVPIIIYVVDTLRADRLGLYGYAEPTSPRIDELAAESVIFDQAYAAAPWTPPSVASLFTSTFACQHGVNGWSKLNSAVPTLAEQLAGTGLITASYHSNLFLGSMLNLDRGYQIRELRKPDDNSRATDVDQFLKTVGEEPFYLYIHTMEPHSAPNTPTKFSHSFAGFMRNTDRNDFSKTKLRYAKLSDADSYAKQPLGTTDNTAQQKELLDYFGDLSFVSPLYDASVFWADSNLGEVVDVLKKSGVWDRAIFIFLSDHGEELGEHGGWFHRQSVYQEIMRIPLIVHFPNGKYGGQRIEDPVSLVDIMPTIFDYLEKPDLCSACRGSSFLPLVQDTSRPASDTDFTVPGIRINQLQYYRPWKESRGDLNVLIRKDDWKGIWNHDLNNLELYDLALDPGERIDVSSNHPELTRDFLEHAASWFDECERNAQPSEARGDFDEETKQKLQSMGYFQ